MPFPLQILLDSTSTNNNSEGPEKLEQVSSCCCGRRRFPQSLTSVSLQLLYLGFDRNQAEAALRLSGGDVQEAAQLLLDHQGVISSELLDNQGVASSELLTPPSEEPSTSSTSTGRCLTKLRPLYSLQNSCSQR